MNLVSIISALSASTLPYIDEAYGSIKSLNVPEGWLIEWLIQQDGDSDSIEKDWFNEEFIKYEYSGDHLRAAGVRNRALLRAKGEYIWSFDSDDLLLPNALETLSEGFSHDGVAWSAGAWEELFPDGTTKEWRHPEYVGVRERNWIYNEIERLGKTPFSMNPVLYKKNAVIKVGGWPAYKYWEDTILLTQISGSHKGWATDEVVGYYRRHERSVSASTEFQDSKDVMYDYIKKIGKLQQ